MWSNDKPGPNGTVDSSLRDLRLGVYGGLGVLQGNQSCFVLCNNDNGSVYDNSMVLVVRTFSGVLSQLTVMLYSGDIITTSSFGPFVKC